MFTPKSHIEDQEGYNERDISHYEMEDFAGMTRSDLGYVGIGTMAPQALLALRKSSNTQIKVRSEINSETSIWLQTPWPMPDRSSSNGLVLELEGVYHLSYGIEQPILIMSFSPEIVGITTNLNVSDNVNLGSNVGVFGNIVVGGKIDVGDNVNFAGKVGIGNVILANYPNNTSKLFVEGGSQRRQSILN